MKHCRRALVDSIADLDKVTTPSTVAMLCLLDTTNFLKERNNVLAYVR